MGPGDNGGGLLLRFSHFSGGDPRRRLADGPPRPEARHRDGRPFDGNRPAAGDPRASAVAALPDARRAGWRRGQLPRLYRAVPLSDQLVRATARVGAEHRVFRRWHRLDHDPSLAAIADWRRRLAYGLLVSRGVGARCLDTPEFAA